MNLSCHCGSVKIEVANKPKSLTSCNCSVCNRYGALWGYYNPEQVLVDIGEGGISKYCWGDKCINFIHCDICGCITHYETTEKVSDAKVVVNFRMANPSEIEGIKIRKFDGAVSWRFIG